jgi:hypothetical protein
MVGKQQHINNEPSTTLSREEDERVALLQQQLLLSAIEHADGHLQKASTACEGPPGEYM